MSSTSAYGASDPRSRLTGPPATFEPEPAGSADYAAFTADDHLVRGQNFVLHYVTANAGTVLRRAHQSDEYVVLLPDAGTHLEVRSGTGGARVTRPSLIVVPPGDSEVTLKTAGRVVRMMTTASAPELAKDSSNATSYASRKPNVAPYAAWPDAYAGPALRVYDLEVPDQPGRFGRIWRCSTFMVNVLPSQVGPRDPHQLSPHIHADFEQCSLALEGDFVHHLRWPWGPDSTQWREDRHIKGPAPSAVTIPPPVVHTTQATGVGRNLLVDIFSPPRADFSQVPGWVLNSDDYPMPP